MLIISRQLHLLYLFDIVLHLDLGALKVTGQYDLAIVETVIDVLWFYAGYPIGYQKALVKQIHLLIHSQVFRYVFILFLYGFSEFLSYQEA